MVSYKFYLKQNLKSGNEGYYLNSNNSEAENIQSLTETLNLNYEEIYNIYKICNGIFFKGLNLNEFGYFKNEDDALKASMMFNLILN